MTRLSQLLLIVGVLFIFARPVAAQADLPADAGAQMSESFVDAAVSGVPLVLVVFGLTAFIKQQGVAGRALLLCALCLGLIFGIGYMVYKTRPPGGDWWVVYGYWFGVFVYGLGLGLLASGVYEGGKAAISSVMGKVLGGGRA